MALNSVSVSQQCALDKVPLSGNTHKTMHTSINSNNRASSKPIRSLSLCFPSHHAPVQDQLFRVHYAATGGFPGDPVVKNLPAMLETWVRSLGGEDPLEKEMATHSSILHPMDGEAWQAIVHGVTKSRIRLSDFHFHSTPQKPSSLAFLFSRTNKQLDIGSQSESYLSGRDETNG